MGITTGAAGEMSITRKIQTEAILKGSMYVESCNYRDSGRQRP